MKQSPRGMTTEPIWMRPRRRAIERALHRKSQRPAESASIRSYPKRLERQRELAMWLVNYDFDYLLSINSNDVDFGYERGRGAVRKLDALLNRLFLGKNWYKSRTKDRVFMFAVPESAGGEIHYHILIKLPPKARANPRKRWNLGRGLTRKLRCKKIFPHGDAQLDRLSGHDEISDSLRQFDTICYVVKALWHSDSWDNCILSSEFR
jgi:hypothetical protein